MSIISSRGEQLCNDLFAALRDLRVGPTGDGPKLIQGVTSNGDLVDGQTMAGCFHDAGEALCASGRVYAMDDSMMYEQRGDNGHALVQIASASRVERCAPALLSNVIAASVQHQKGEIQSTIPAKLIYALLLNEAFRSELPRIREYARRPMYDTDFILRGPGWHADPGILIHGSDITSAPFEPPVAPNGLLGRLPPLVRTLLCEFCWGSDADLLNALGFLLTGLLLNHFLDEPHPIGLLDGNQVGVGKTLLVRVLSLVLDDINPPPIRYTGDDELEKKLGARLRDAVSGVLLLDNVRGQIDSPLLEQNTLSPVISLRILGQSRDVRRRNRYLWCVTCNGTEATQDMLSRSVPIRLRYEGNPRERTFALPDLLRFAREHRLELLGELAGLVDNWKLRGMPLGRQQHRCRRWAAVIGGILDAAELGTFFLANLHDAEREMDEGLAALTALADQVLRADDRVLLNSEGATAKAWVEHLRGAGVLPAPRPSESMQAGVTRAGRMLSSLVNRPVSIETEGSGCTVILRRTDGRSRQTRYRLEVSAPEKDTPPEMGQEASPPATLSTTPIQDTTQPVLEPLAGAAPDGVVNDLDWGA
jgi:hypothetical protein